MFVMFFGTKGILPGIHGVLRGFNSFSKLWTLIQISVRNGKLTQNGYMYQRLPRNPKLSLWDFWWLIPGIFRQFGLSAHAYPTLTDTYLFLFVFSVQSFAPNSFALTINCIQLQRWQLPTSSTERTTPTWTPTNHSLLLLIFLVEWSLPDCK